MNAQQTRAEANRQIRLLMQDCTPEERERLRKYIRPVHSQPVWYKKSGPERIGDILPRVMANIERCMEHRKGRQP